MHVTFCAYDRPNDVSGPNTWLIRLLPALVREGIEVSTLFLKKTEDETPTVVALRSRGVECSEVVLPTNFSIAAGRDHVVRLILERIAEGPPDVFVPNVVSPAYYAAALLRHEGISTVGIVHSDDRFHRSLVETFVFGNRKLRVSVVVCVSRSLERDIAIRNPKQTVVRRIPYGVPIPDRTADPPRDILSLVYVGRLVDEQKRISQTAMQLCRAVREVAGTDAVIYGEGPDKDSVERIVAEEGRGLPVSIAGRVDSTRVQQRLLDSHVLVLLSEYEGLPISVMEAMACGLVPICTWTQSGIPELIEDGRNGLIVNDVGELTAAVRRLREGPTLWRRLSAGARSTIEDAYSMEACTLRWLELLNEAHMMGSRRPLRVPWKVTIGSSGGFRRILTLRRRLGATGGRESR